MARKTEPQSGEGFVRRWSRRKSETADGAGDEETSARETGSDDDQHTARPIVSDTHQEPESITEKPVLTDADMPPLESLDERSDYSGFFSPGVSRTLKRAAMRKLFASAGFNIRDGLDDYDDDFRNFTPLGDIVTSEMKFRQQMAEKREREEQRERLARAQESPQSMNTDTEPGEAEQLAQEEQESHDDGPPDPKLAEETPVEAEQEDDDDEPDDAAGRDTSGHS